MITCSDINRFIKAGIPVLASVPGTECLATVLKARVGLGDVLQVRVRIKSAEEWRTVDRSAICVTIKEKSS